MASLETRLHAHAYFKRLQYDGLEKRDIVQRVSQRYPITQTTIYSWFGGQTPIGTRAGRIECTPELAYVLGALLGDGCAYLWRKHYQVWLYGEEEFARKFGDKLSACLGRAVRHYRNEIRNVSYVRVDNFELFMLLKGIRSNLRKLEELIAEGGRTNRRLLFVEGFFDAEGCVKVIKETVRKTPKICLDICNTNHQVLTLVQGILASELGIQSNFSYQKIVENHMQVYHLRIYRKEHVSKFLKSINTIKLKLDKIPYVTRWLEKGT